MSVAADARLAEKKDVDLGAMSEWDLTALYPRQDAPEVAADIDAIRSAYVRSIRICVRTTENILKSYGRFFGHCGADSSPEI